MIVVAALSYLAHPYSLMNLFVCLYVFDALQSLTAAGSQSASNDDDALLQPLDWVRAVKAATYTTISCTS